MKENSILYKLGYFYYHSRVFVLIFTLIIFCSSSYKIEDILFILFVGGTYGILTKAESYKKIVNNVVDFIKGKEVIAFSVITLLMGLYTSISNNIMALFFLIPFSAF